MDIASVYRVPFKSSPVFGPGVAEMGVSWSPLREQLRVCGRRGRRSLRNTWQVPRKGCEQKDGSGEKPGVA